MQLFFIVGAQKSGTTWLQKSLNSIDGIHCMGEGHFIDKLLMPVAQTRHEYNKMMEVVHQRVYEGKGFYDPVPDQEFLRVMRSWIFNIMVRNTRVPENTIVAGVLSPRATMVFSGTRVLRTMMLRIQDRITRRNSWSGTGP